MLRPSSCQRRRVKTQIIGSCVVTRGQAHLAPMDSHGAADAQICKPISVARRRAKERAVRLVGWFGKPFALGADHGTALATRARDGNFTHLNRVVSEEVAEREIAAVAKVACLVPHALELQYFAVILDELQRGVGALAFRVLVLRHTSTRPCRCEAASAFHWHHGLLWGGGNGEIDGRAKQDVAVVVAEKGTRARIGVCNDHIEAAELDELANLQIAHRSKLWES
mmetsp:Transcript_8080/g.22946  ORF Transcript_8080/g.22946 Transcript_8080/m.22946 type:complete len:225 (+) Transcript_8080:913-1587(+)